MEEQQTTEYKTGVRELTPENVVRFTEAFLADNQIDPLHVMIDRAVVTQYGEQEYHITIYAAFTGYLIGMKGERSKKLAGALTHFFSKKLKLEIKS
jgi:ribosomal protein S3